MIYEFPLQMNNYILFIDSSLEEPMLGIKNKISNNISYARFCPISINENEWLHNCFDGLVNPFSKEDEREFVQWAESEMYFEDDITWNFAEDLAWKLKKQKK